MIVLALCLREVTASFEAVMVFAARSPLIGVFGDPSTAGWQVICHLTRDTTRLMQAASEHCVES